MKRSWYCGTRTASGVPAPATRGESPGMSRTPEQGSTRPSNYLGQFGCMATGLEDVYYCVRTRTTGLEAVKRWRVHKRLRSGARYTLARGHGPSAIRNQHVRFTLRSTLVVLVHFEYFRMHKQTPIRKPGTKAACEDTVLPLCSSLWCALCSDDHCWTEDARARRRRPPGKDKFTGG